MSDKRLNQYYFGDGDGSEPIRHPMQRIIEQDIEHFRRTFNDPEPPKVYEYGDGSGLRVRIFEVSGNACPRCGARDPEAVDYMTDNPDGTESQTMRCASCGEAWADIQPAAPPRTHEEE